MMTFDGVVYGPVQSRRLGLSLGINLLPTENKVCSFECVYCECGFTKKGVTAKFPSFQKVEEEMTTCLRNLNAEGKQLDVITFAGNGEPTLYPHFEKVIDLTIRLRDQFHPNSKISVLTNATRLSNESVVRALKKVDNNILKIDSAINSTAKLIDVPVDSHYDVNTVIEQMSQFNGEFILQTMFLRGTVEGNVIDNTTEEEVNAWYEAVERMSPKQIMIYSIDRETPYKELEKVSHEELEKIAGPLRKKGFDVMSA